MPQLILLALFLTVAFLGYRKFVKDAEKLARRREELRRQEANNASGTLVQDPDTGVYSVRKEED